MVVQSYPMSIFDKALHIPAERRLFGPQTAPHERVLLPLHAGPSARFYAAILLAALAALSCGVMGYEMAFASGADGGARLFALVFLAASTLPAAVAVAGIRDALRPTPFLHIDAHGTRDTRLDSAPIAWGDVLRAEIVSSPSGIGAVRLVLATDGPPRFNPFRLGGWRLDWGDRHRSRVIALALLDVRAHTLAHTILLLAARHGATIEEPALVDPRRW